MSKYPDRRYILAAFGMAGGMSLAAPVKAQDVANTPTSPMPPIEVFASSPLVDEIALSPDGKRIAIISQVDDEKRLLYFDIADLKIKKIIIGKDKIRNLFWADNDHVVLVSSTTDQLTGFVGKAHEFSQARLVQLNTLKTTLLFDGQEGVYSIVRGNLKRIKVGDTYRLTASTYRFDKTYTAALYSFDLDKARGRLISEESSDTEGWVVTPGGHPLAYSEYNDERKQWSLFYNMSEPVEASRFRLIYSVTSALGYPSLKGLGRDGKSVVIHVDKGDAGSDYHEISAEGVLGEPLGQSGKEGERNVLFHPTTSRLAGFSHHGDWIEYDYFDPLLKKLVDALPKIMGDDYRSAIADFAEDPRMIILYGESAKDAGTYYFTDLSTGKYQVLATNYADIPEEWITQKKPIRYKAADGLEINGYLTLPPFKPDKNLPLVVLPHGGPQMRDYIDFDWQVQALASRGYAVLQPNYRGSSGYGEGFIEAGHNEFGRKMQTDLSDGVRYLVAQGIADPKRVAIMGASYGGYAALAGATLDSGVYNCAISIAGLSDMKDWIDFVIENNELRESSRVLYWQQFLGEPKGYDAISPAKQASKASCPVLLIHGTDDTVVPIEQSRRMEKAMKLAGKPVEFVTYKGQDHWESIGSARIEMMKAALAFLEKHNPAR